MSWKPTTIPSKRLAASITGSAMAIVLNNIKGWDGADLTAADFGTQAFGIFRNTENTVVEIFEFDPSTIASASITILRRGLKFTGDLTTEVAGNKLTWVRNETIVELGADVPQLFELLKAYIDGVSVAGAADASQTAKGVVEVATAAQINSGEDLGETGAPVAMTPDQFALSNYGLYASTSKQKDFLNGIVGMVLPYAGAAAPTGFLLCDGADANIATYAALAAVIKDTYGRGAGVAFTVTAATDLVNANSHGLSDTTPIVLSTTGTLPAGLSANTIYYVRDATVNSFKLAATSGGSAIDITDTGSGSHKYHVEVKVPDLRARMPIGAGAGTFVFDFLPAAVTAADDTITVPSNTTVWSTGMVVQLTTTGTLPAGLSLATDYYVIRVSATTIKLASTLANALGNSNSSTPYSIVPINITDQGSGIHTATQTLSTRVRGDKGGEETHTTSLEEMPNHNHELYGHGGSGTSPRGVQEVSDGGSNTGTLERDASMSKIGGDVAHNMMSPYLVLNYIIKT